MTEKNAVIDIGSDLSKELQNTDYNGVTQLQINIDNINSSATTWIAAERGLGIVVALLGGYYGGCFVIASQGGYSVQTTDYIPVFVTLGAGLGIYGCSYIHEKFAKVDYKITMNGVKVSF